MPFARRVPKFIKLVAIASQALPLIVMSKQACLRAARSVPGSLTWRLSERIGRFIAWR